MTRDHIRNGRLPPPPPIVTANPRRTKHYKTLHIFFVLLYPVPQIHNATILDESIDLYFTLAATNQRVRERYGDAVIDIPGHETVLRPKETQQRLCDHLVLYVLKITSKHAGRFCMELRLSPETQ